MNHPILKLIAFVLTTTLLAFAGLAYGAPPQEDCETLTHCVLMSAPVHKTDLDEPPEERSVRLREMADDLDAATPKRLERAMLVALAVNESHLARFVDLDWPKCREGHGGWCDSGRAFGVIQAHEVPRDTSRRELFRIGIKRLRRGGNYCASKGFDWVSGAFSLYATGSICDWSGAEARADEAWKIWGRL